MNYCRHVTAPQNKSSGRFETEEKERVGMSVTGAELSCFIFIFFFYFLKKALLLIYAPLEKNTFKGSRAKQKEQQRLVSVSSAFMANKL